MVGDYERGCGFQVAEYRKPDFQVELTPENDAVLVGNTINVTVDAKFFFGGPVSNADVEWTALLGGFFFDYTGPGRWRFMRTGCMTKGSSML